MAELFPIELQDMREECQRELDIRKRVYSNAVLHRTMNRRLADRRIDIMAAVVALLDRLISEQGRGKDA
jgi:hypothetical protein